MRAVGFVHSRVAATFLAVGTSLLMLAACLHSFLTLPPPSLLAGCPSSCCCPRDLLSIKRRFLVLSIESKLLVLLPNQHGELVAICPKELAYGDELTSEVVRTIMGVSQRAAPSLGSLWPYLCTASCNLFPPSCSHSAALASSHTPCPQLPAVVGGR